MDKSLVVKPLLSQVAELLNAVSLAAPNHCIAISLTASTYGNYRSSSRKTATFK